MKKITSIFLAIVLAVSFSVSALAAYNLEDAEAGSYVIGSHIFTDGKLTMQRVMDAARTIPDGEPSAIYQKNPLSASGWDNVTSGTAVPVASADVPNGDDILFVDDDEIDEEPEPCTCGEDEICECACEDTCECECDICNPTIAAFQAALTAYLNEEASQAGFNEYGIPLGMNDNVRFWEEADTTYVYYVGDNVPAAPVIAGWMAGDESDGTYTYTADNDNLTYIIDFDAVALYAITFESDTNNATLTINDGTDDEAEIEYANSVQYAIAFAEVDNTLTVTDGFKIVVNDGALNVELTNGSFTATSRVYTVTVSKKVLEPIGISAELITTAEEAIEAGLVENEWDWENQSIPGAHWMILKYTVGDVDISIKKFEVTNGNETVFESTEYTQPVLKSAGTSTRTGIEAADLVGAAADAKLFPDGEYTFTVFYIINGTEEFSISDTVTVANDKDDVIAWAKSDPITYIERDEQDNMYRFMQINFARKVAVESNTLTITMKTPAASGTDLNNPMAGTVLWVGNGAVSANENAWYQYGYRNGATVNGKVWEMENLEDRAAIEQNNIYLLQEGAVINIMIEVEFGGVTYSIEKDYTITAADVANATFLTDTMRAVNDAAINQAGNNISHDLDTGKVDGTRKYVIEIDETKSINGVTYVVVEGEAEAEEAATLPVYGDASEYASMIGLMVGVPSGYTKLTGYVTEYKKEEAATNWTTYTGTKPLGYCYAAPGSTDLVDGGAITENGLLAIYPYILWSWGNDKTDPDNTEEMTAEIWKYTLTWEDNSGNEITEIIIIDLTNENLIAGATPMMP